MKKSSSISSITAILFGFFIMGFCDIVGVAVSYAKETFQWSEFQAGFLPSMVFIWFFIVSIPTVIVMNKLGRKNTVLISMVLTFAGMILPLLHFNAITCYLAFSLLGIGNTVLQVSLNPLLSNVIKGDKLTSSLTAGQFIKAISSFLGPIIAGICVSLFDNWAFLFPIYAAITLLTSLWLYASYIPREESNAVPLSFSALITLLREQRIMLLFLGILCIVGLDVGMNTITPKLLMERVGMSTQSASYGASWYFAARTLGTAIGAILLSKVSEKKYFPINMFICLLAIIGLCFVQEKEIIIALICIIAFTASSIFAVIYSLAIQTNQAKSNEISGLMITGVAGGAIAPPLMGYFTELLHQQIGGLLVIGSCALYLFILSLKEINRQ